jgi:succinoglycan biosynthesis transport protein ExoP
MSQISDPTKDGRGKAGGSRPRFEEASRTSVPPEHLAVVPQSVTMADSESAEEFRILGAKIKALDEERPFRCVGIVSASPGEGKSTVALGLATALAREEDCRVLLVDGDLRKPALEGYLRLPRTTGLYEWLLGSEPAVSLRRVEPQGFYLVAPGLTPQVRPELLGSTRMAAFLGHARESFDYVLVDCSPLVPVADSVIIQDLLDGFLFVVRARRSHKETIVKALSHLRPDRVRGVVFNDHREVIPGYKSYGYRAAVASSRD